MLALACLTIALGVWMIVSGILDWEWYTIFFGELALAEALLSENAARILCIVSGTILVGLGVAYLPLGS